jgi:GNAT superfamily N-acetyltransferase
MSNYTIKPMTRADLAVAVDWAAAEGWNPGLHDADCFYAADPSGFLMGWLGDTPIAAISVVKYGASFGFLGFYMVRPEFRGQGYGWQLWQAGLDYLAGCTIGLDGVVDQQSNYLKSGFQLAYRNIRYEGISVGSQASPNAAIAPLSSLPIDRC